MNELALFAGVGGGVLGGKLLGWRTVCYVERDPYCIQVLRARIGDGCLDDAPIWDDVKTFDGRPWAGRVDIITAGFPCQPHSLAGKRAGAEDERNLWPETLAIIRQVRPEWCLLENVPGLISNGYIGVVLGGLAEAGYDAEWGVLSAEAVGAPHKRERVWIVGHTQQFGCHGQPWGRAGQELENGYMEVEARDVADAERTGLEIGQWSGRTEGSGACVPASGGDWWATEPTVGRVAHGVAHRVDRLRTIGNGQVSLVAAVAAILLRQRIEEEINA